MVLFKGFFSKDEQESICSSAGLLSVLLGHFKNTDMT